MYTPFPAGTDRVIEMEFVDGTGAPVVPVSASYVLLDESDEVIVASTALDVTPPTATIEILVPGVSNQLGGMRRAFRSLVMSFTDADGNDFEQKYFYVLQTSDVLEIGVNAFARFGTLAMLLIDMPNLTEARAASATDLTSALVAAYHNIGGLCLDLTPEVYESNTMDLTPELIALIPADKTLKLHRASLIEANAILGGNPVEDRRKLGLMSHSAGESAHFFRPTRPLDLPVSRDTARALSPMIRYSLRAGR